MNDCNDAYNRETLSHFHDQWLEPPVATFVSRCPCDPCPLCGGKKMEHNRYDEHDGRFYDCAPGDDDILCGCRPCACGFPIAEDAPFDECARCLTGQAI